MLVSQSIWDEFTIDSIANGMVRLWYALEEFVSNMGPGTLLLCALGGGVIYYFIVRPR
jgi:hypothetical protein